VFRICAEGHDRRIVGVTCTTSTVPSSRTPERSRSSACRTSARYPDGS
jgi:hypothetical protein